MKLVTLSFASAAEVLAVTRDSSIFFRTRTELELGEEVVMEVRFAQLAEPVVARGAVTQLSESGAWIRFADEASISFLRAAARGAVGWLSQRERNNPRLPVDLPASCRVEGPGSLEEFEAMTIDIGSGGAFLRAGRAPEVGTRVRVVLGPTPDKGEQFVMFGDVAWTGKVGEEDGFGVRFRNLAGDGMRLRQRIRRSRETGEILFAS